MAKKHTIKLILEVSCTDIEEQDLGFATAVSLGDIKVEGGIEMKGDSLYLLGMMSPLNKAIEHALKGAVVDLEHKLMQREARTACKEASSDIEERLKRAAADIKDEEMEGMMDFMAEQTTKQFGSLKELPDDHIKRLEEAMSRVGIPDYAISRFLDKLGIAIVEIGINEDDEEETEFQKQNV